MKGYEKALNAREVIEVLYNGGCVKQKHWKQAYLFLNEDGDLVNHQNRRNAKLVFEGLPDQSYWIEYDPPKPKVKLYEWASKIDGRWIAHAELLSAEDATIEFEGRQHVRRGEPIEVEVED